MKNKIRMGVIGLGQISDTHINGIVDSHGGEVVALCDVDEIRLEEYSHKLNINDNMCYRNYKEMIDDKNVDAVSICTPNDTHFDIARYAIEKNKPFALEKPITLNREQAKILCDMCYSKNVNHMVCFSYRFKSAARYARHLVQSGFIGKIRHVYGSYYQSWANSKEIPLYWRFNKSRSGSGTLGDIGCHMIDLISFIVGDITEVSGDSGTFIESRREQDGDKMLPVDVDDYFNALIKLDDNISGTVTSSRFAYGRGNYQSLEIYGEKGALKYNLEKEDTLEMCYSDVMARGCHFVEVTIPDEFKMSQMQQFINIMNGKGDGLAGNLKDGYINQVILDTMLQSDKERKWIKINY